MKILNRTEFFQQPAGILYRIQRTQESSFEGIEIKSDNCGTYDFACMEFGYSITNDETDMWLDSNISRPIKTDYYGRDGGFDTNALFLVYETWDLEQMRGIIDHALTVAPKQQFQNPWD